ncbi:helix-turn-helix domain-containing protein [Nocardia sp. CDC159]|uniref:Helix-turn-helix domain-containing protein n=1 Tax=Nocardia pulmonis TaxID=2951408 RepID=A0A9X2J0V9_9NOCA|nr:MULTISPECIES: helix-turn-helix domain-containing protein [Nocardia]MCM6778239.1 helix-turn-helix domain-containing protein [Nocardia pulmonis]MCM6791128.1 helix-turn-helix domain-containing protein [Nocardia sp. CDC159]
MGAVDVGREPDAEWDFAGPAGAVRPGVAMIGYRDSGGAGLDLRVAGTTAVTVVIGFGDRELVVDDAVGRRRLDGFVAGLPLEAMRVRTERAACIEVRLSPIQAYSLLGFPPTDLGRGVVGLADLWGRRARRLREQLASAPTWDERFAVTESFLAQGDRPTRTPDPEVLACWNRILATRGRVRIGELADSVGWSHKRLWSRFESQIGLTPKRAAMLVRFRYAVDGLLAGRSAADVAAECGYTDQAHLCRDVSIFADHTPGALRTHYLPTIARHRYRAWGKFFQYRAEPIGR